jgi:hypothetical protein
MSHRSQNKSLLEKGARQTEAQNCFKNSKTKQTRRVRGGTHSQQRKKKEEKQNKRIQYQTKLNEKIERHEDKSLPLLACSKESPGGNKRK